MIETVYSSGDGDINQTARVQAAFKLPKNVRQVGKSNAARKIYVEDYVMTFIKQLSGEDYSKCKIAVLIGQNVKTEGCRNIFIYGAIEVEENDMSSENLFSNDTWTSIYENIKKYFVEAEIVGWFIGGPGYLLEDKDHIMKIHIDNFAGQDKTLLTFDNMEKEEAFLFYENNQLCKQDGYYIYYEKNEEMQTYMIEHKSKVSAEADYDDRVSKEIRTVIQSKKPETKEDKSVTRLMYAAGTLLAVIILVVGAAMLNNYDQMKTMQSTLDSLSRNLEEVKSGTDGDQTNTQTSEGNADNVPVTSESGELSDGSLAVEVVPGKVTPIGDEQQKPASGEELVEDNTDAADGQNSSDDGSEASQEDNTSQDTKQKPEIEEVKYYTVVSGDSLAGISLKLYHTIDYVADIKELNNIVDEDLIYIGQKLIVP